MTSTEPLTGPPRSSRRWFRTILLVALLLFALEAVFSYFERRAIWRKSIAVVYIEGPIYDSLPVVQVLRSLRRSSKVKALVIRVDSPGGSVAASEEIHEAVRRFKEENTKRPVIISMGNSAASGGYMVSVAGDEIFANPGTVTGSIGVIAAGMVIADLLRTIGIQPEVVKSGELKDTGSPLRRWTDRDSEFLQQLTFDMYRQFFRVVLRSRDAALAKAAANTTEISKILDATTTSHESTGSLHLTALSGHDLAAESKASSESVALLARIADGRILTGRQAAALGLVDRTGTLEDAIERAGELSGLGDDPHLVERRPYASFPSLFGVSLRRAADAFSSEGSRLQLRDPGH